MRRRKMDSPHLDAPRFRRALGAWYRASARDLPWRRTIDPYKIWLSEIMLQQTRVEQGLSYYERFIAAFPDVHALAAAKEDRVLKLWEGLGYYSRARNLHRAARIVARDWDGNFPRSAEALRALPGIGRYTAGAIASIAFGERAPVLDGNVIRVLSRIYNIADCADNAKVRGHFWTLASSLVPPKRPGDFNQAMMELGACVCVPKGPRCAVCPVRRFCAAYTAGVQEERPVRKAKPQTPRYEMVAAFVRHNEKYLLAKRPSTGLLGGLWEFPCGAVRRGEKHQRAIARELRERFRISVNIGDLIASVQHSYSHFKVTLHVYACDLVRGESGGSNGVTMRWVPRSRFTRYALPKIVHKFLRSLQNMSVQAID